jgi:hypothetical protein
MGRSCLFVHMVNRRNSWKESDEIWCCESIQKVKVKGEAVPVLNWLVIKHYAMKEYGEGDV